MPGLAHLLRALKRDPVLTAAATLTLAICIGANTTVFSLVDSILLRPLPFPSADRLYWLSERMGPDQLQVGLGPDYYSLREQTRIFADVVEKFKAALSTTRPYSREVAHLERCSKAGESARPFYQHPKIASGNSGGSRTGPLRRCTRFLPPVAGCDSQDPCSLLD